MPETSFAGRFLVATPIITTPPFARSVVLLLEHDESGAIGVVLNQPTNLAVQDHLPEIDGVLSDPALVFLGGPVSSETAIALGRGSSADFLRPVPSRMSESSISRSRSTTSTIFASSRDTRDGTRTNSKQSSRRGRGGSCSRTRRTSSPLRQTTSGCGPSSELPGPSPSTRPIQRIPQRTDASVILSRCPQQFRACARHSWVTRPESPTRLPCGRGGATWSSASTKWGGERGRVPSRSAR